MVIALGEIGDPSAVEALLEHVRSDAYVPVRIEAARALVKLGDRRVAPALGALAKHDPDPTVRAAALDAARVLKQGK
jgi:HEAT repeat protein